MRKAFRHSGVLMMAAVVALGLLGAAYTLWFEDLQITAQVSTGTFDADVSLHPWDPKEEGGFGGSQTQPGTYPGSGKPVVIVCGNPIPSNLAAAHNLLASIGSGNPYDCTFGGFPQGKPPTTCDASIATYGAAPANANDVTDENQLNLVLGGLYPFAGCTYRVDIHNSGTVPMHLNVMPVGTYMLCPAGATWANQTGCTPLAISDPGISNIAQCTGPGGIVDDDQDANGQVEYLNGNAVQLHTGQEMVCDLTILLDQGANLENKVILASLTFRAYQWNETIDTTP